MTHIDRRTLLRAGLVAGAGVAGGALLGAPGAPAAPGLRPGGRPLLTHGVQSGDVTLDGTFGPKAVFVHAPPRANTSPAEGFQHFGEVTIDGPSAALTVHLRDRSGASLWTTTLPAPSRR
ncbi:hypothetical protein AMK25_31025 [Micromonospora sp. TSRI0369]|nr:hypothetical protein AMK25_31025 [Micromonospora sp. TSRI0369]